MHDLVTFRLSDMVECGVALRGLGEGAADLREVADRTVRYLRENLVDSTTGAPACPLVRFFKTGSFESLDPDSQQFARNLLPGRSLSGPMPCLTLLATTGERPEWNSCSESVGHRAIPLPSESMVERFPMISQLIRQLGLDVGNVLHPDPELIVDLEQRAFNVFLVSEAEGNPCLPAQQEFVRPFGIRSALGFGGILPTGELFAIILFSRVPVARQTADFFATLALSVKIAILPFVDIPTDDDPDHVRRRLATIEQLLQVQEQTVSEQCDLLQQAHNEAEQRAAELAAGEEALRRAKAAAEAANHGKSVFVTNMSHELRTPLTAILGMSELALGTALSPVQRDYLETIDESAESLLMLVNDILDFSKIEGGKFELEIQPFRFQETLYRTLHMLAGRAHERGLELTCHVGQDVPDRLEGDPVRVRQIVTNLVGNAIKFTESGEVAVTVAVDSIERGTVVLHLAVRDTGIGIPAEKQERIFEAFSQADMTTARRFGGTGLGLTITSQIVHEMDGAIWVESEEGRGSKFHCTLRLALPAEPGTGPYAARRPEIVGLPILVADDSATHCHILEELLRDWLLEPTVVQSGRAAIAAFRQAKKEKNPFSLLLLDCEMPVRDGFAVGEELLQDPGAAAELIMMLTSRDVAQSIARAEQLGASHVLKPVHPAKLLDALVRAAGRKSSRDPQVEGRPPAPAIELPRLRILLADDSDLNRKLVFGVLGRGHHYVVALNGEEAVERFRSEEFDLVLMDVQMPGIDGFEAARRIRAHEKSTGRHVPMVAMTAYALKGDRDRCLAAGMDEYISKPMRARQLAETIQRARVAAGSESATRDEPLDWSEALETVEGDRALLRRVVDAFRTESPALIETIRNALRQGDQEAFDRSVHTLRGSLGHVGARRAAEVASGLEMHSPENGGRDIEETLAWLDAEVARILETLERNLTRETT